MALYLVNPSVEMSLELYVSTRLEEALTIQYERIRDRRVRDTGFYPVSADGLIKA